jgi:hypothetical protein
MRKRLLRLIATAFWLAWLLSPLAAQVPGSGDLLLRVVTTCGTLPAAYTAGQDRFAVMDINGNFCTAASVSASIAGFAPGAAFANLTATGSSADVALPAGTVVLFQNTGTTAVSCTLSIGAGTAVANENIIQPASWLAFTVGSNTHGSCIDQTGSVSNVVVLTGGSGIPTGSGGGSGGGGGAITAASGAFASGSLAVGSGTDGWNVTEGAKADAAWVSGSGSIVAVLKAIANFESTIAINTGAPIPVGTNAIGTVNPTTPANWGLGATGSSPPANALQIGANASGATGGQMRGLINCDNHIFKHITTATDTMAVQGVASQTIYICGWRSRAAGIATWFLENTASANANCSSANTQITGVATEAANTGEVAKSEFWDGLKNTSGNGLCINSTGTGGIDIDIWYTQF